MQKLNKINQKIRKYIKWKNKFHNIIIEKYWYGYNESNDPEYLKVNRMFNMLQEKLHYCLKKRWSIQCKKK